MLLLITYFFLLITLRVSYLKWFLRSGVLTSTGLLRSEVLTSMGSYILEFLRLVLLKFFRKEEFFMRDL